MGKLIIKYSNINSKKKIIKKTDIKNWLEIIDFCNFITCNKDNTDISIIISLRKTKKPGTGTPNNKQNDNN